jgi:phage repressor protein C with HTH and peptisase S24 domain
MNDIEIMRKAMYTYDLTQAKVSKILNCSDAYINQVLKGKNKLSQSKKKLLLEHCPIDIDESNELIDVKYFDNIDGSCGSGSFIDDNCKHTEILQLSSKYGLSRNEKYFAINATGDSMAKTILDKDIVIFEDWRGRQIEDNKIYLISYEGKNYIKRLIYNIDEVVVISDNKAKDEKENFIYETKKITGENINRLYVIGKFRGKIEKE